MDKEKRISVCMATYNGERYVAQQIASILEQLGPDDELVISDDGSTDRTCDIIRGIGDERILLLRNELAHGVNGNFENALRHSHGKYLFLSDQDDVWLPGKVEHCIEGLRKNVCVVHDAYITDGDLNVVIESSFKRFNGKKGFFRNWVRNGYLGCAMAFRRELLDTALPIPADLPVWHDIWFGSIAQLKYNIDFIPFKGIKFRRHSYNTSISSEGTFPLLKMISYRMGLLKFLFYRLCVKR